MLKVLKSGIQGVGIGSIIFLLLGVVYTDAATKKTIISVLIMSFIIGLLSKVYDFTKISILVKTLIHAGGSYLAFIVTAYINQWFPFAPGIIVTASIIFIALFFSAWTFFYIQAKKEISLINKHMV